MENEPGFNPESEQSPENGENVDITLKFIRHGERDPEGNLLDYGREATKDQAEESGLTKEEFDAVKAIGSPAGPTGPTGMQRSLETAHIYAKTIAGDEAFNTRQNKVLSYESLVLRPPYDHREIYDSYLPADFDELSPEEKAKASKVANQETVNHLVKLDTPEALAYKQEIAGSYAYVIDHYMQVAKRLKPGYSALLPAGTHGGLMEFILKEALIREDEEGNKVRGFTDLKEIGGSFDPSEAFNIDISTNEEGDPYPLKVTFDNSERPTYHKMYLDSNRIQELKTSYEELHSTEKDD